MLAYSKNKLDYFSISNESKIKKDTIKNIFDNFILEEDLEVVDVWDMYLSGDYKSQFALYTIDTSENAEDRRPYKLIWYRYWSKYNRSNENQPITPKVLFLDLWSSLFEINIYGDNAVVILSKSRDTWRDSYYLSNHQSIVDQNPIDVVKYILKDKNIYIWWVGWSIWNFEWLSGMDSLKLTNLFTKATWFDNRFAYMPYYNIQLDDLINNYEKIFVEYSNDLRNKKISSNNIEEIQEIWKQWWMVLPQ